MTATPDIQAAVDALRQAEAAYMAATRVAWRARGDAFRRSAFASVADNLTKVRDASARLRALIAAAKKEHKP